MERRGASRRNIRAEGAIGWVSLHSDGSIIHHAIESRVGLCAAKEQENVDPTASHAM